MNYEHVGRDYVFVMPLPRCLQFFSPNEVFVGLFHSSHWGSESCVNLMFHSVGVRQLSESVTGIKAHKNTLDLSFDFKFLTWSV